MAEKFACGYVIDYKDGGPSDEQVLHIGTLEDCQRVGSNLHAVSVGNTRPVKECRFVIVPYKDDPATLAKDIAGKALLELVPFALRTDELVESAVNRMAAECGVSDPATLQEALRLTKAAVPHLKH